MEGFPVVALLLLVTVVTGVIVAAFTWRRRKTGTADATDYRTLLIIGIACFLSGATLLVVLTALEASWVIAWPVLIIGVVYTSLGWSKRALWRHR